MTKKRLEKQRKEFDEFVANVEKMGGRFLTEDELRLKINGGGDAGGGDTKTETSEAVDANGTKTQDEARPNESNGDTSEDGEAVNEKSDVGGQKDGTQNEKTSDTGKPEDLGKEKSGSVYAHVSDYAFNENSSFFLNAGAKCDIQYENGSFNGFTVEPFLSGTIHIDLK